MFKQRKKPKKYCLLNSNVEPKLLEYIPTESVKYRLSENANFQNKVNVFFQIVRTSYDLYVASWNRGTLSCTINVQTRKKTKKYCLLHSNVEPKLLEYIPTEAVTYRLHFRVKMQNFKTKSICSSNSFARHTTYTLPPGTAEYFPLQ